MLVEVVGAVQGGVVLLGDGPPGGIDQGRVDLEQAAGLTGALQAVIDDRGDLVPVGAVGLLLNQGSDGDDVGEVVAPGSRLLKERRQLPLL